MDKADSSGANPDSDSSNAAADDFSRTGEAGSPPPVFRSAASGREYLLGVLTQAKLNRKTLAELDASIASWRRRVELATQAGDSTLEMASRGELAAIQDKAALLLAETESLEAEAATLRRQLPGLEARERSIDPDLLEQELLMAAGREPDSGDALAVENKLRELEKKAAVDSALAALKASMGLSTTPDA